VVFSSALVLILAGVTLAGPPEGFPEQAWVSWVFWIWPVGLALQFGLGVLAFRMRHLGNRLWSAAGALLLLGTYLLGNMGVQGGFAATVALPIGVALLLVGAQSESRVNRLLSTPGLVQIGTVSYSLYLLHFLVAISLINDLYSTWNTTTWLAYLINFSVSTLL